MSTLKAKELSKLGYTNDQARSLVVNSISRHFKHHSRQELVTLLMDIKAHPEDYLKDEILNKIARTFLVVEDDRIFNVFSLLPEHKTGPLKIIGGKEIEASAKKQMEGAMSLPITVQGALMPDAHTGYGLPIGGVVATNNAVIPFGVGVDIGCRMALSILNESDSFLRRYSHQVKITLKEYTHFGMEGDLDFHQEHEVLDSPLFQSTELLKRMQGKDKEAGQEYWLSMNLAGDYAKACHDRIHGNVLKALGLQALVTVGNHHNFAWKDQLADGREVIIHRKGATPAHEGEWGIIPGSMTTAAYLVKGRGVDHALYSASHGAGRAMSRKRAKENMTAYALKKMLSDAGVTLIGGSVEENPLAYKDIEKVMNAQQELVEVQGRFLPKIVRMNKE